MRHRFHPGSLVLLSCLLASPCHGDDNNLKFVRAAQAATALVVLPDEGGFASSFCIDAGGYFVTNAHVVANLAPGAKLSLVLNTGQASEQTIKATAVRVNKEDDLAVLKAEGFKELTVLPLGTVDDLAETQQVTVLGFPFGKALALEKTEYPSVSVNVARVSSLRKLKGQLEQIQLDSQLNPGNSGGPVLDQKGNVIGVVSSGVLSAGINFAVPVSKLTAMLSKPELSFTPPTIAADKRHEPIDLTIQTTTFGKPRADLSVEVVLITIGGAERSFPARLSGADTYTARVIPIPARSGPTSYPVELSFGDGSMRCCVEDMEFKLDGKTFHLSELARIESKDSKTTLVSRDGTTTTGSALEMQPIKASFGSYVLPVDAAKATSIVIHEPADENAAVSYRVLAKSKGVVLTEVKGILLGNPADAVADAAGADGAKGGADDDGKWVELLPKIDVKRDTDSGTWELHGATLANAHPAGRKRETARLTIPDMPTGNYELQFTFNRKDGTQDLCVLFPAGGHGAQLWLGAFTGQSSSLAGPNAKARDDLVRIINKKPQQVLLTVVARGDHADVEVKLNGAPYLSWKGKVSELKVDPERATRDGRTLGLAVYQTTTVEFSNIRLHPLSGTVAPYVSGQ